MIIIKGTKRLHITMEDNEKVEETTEKNDEELEETEAEEVEEETNEEEETDDDTPSSEDYEALQKKLKTIEAQKEHWRKKATSKPKNEETKKTNTEQVKETDIIELARLASKGYSDEEISLLKDIKSVKRLGNLSEAIETPLFKANLKEKQEREKKEKASLNASNKPLSYKSGKEPSNEDLKKAWTGK